MQRNYMDRIGDEPFTVDRPYYCTGCGKPQTEQFDKHSQVCPGVYPTALYDECRRPNGSVVATHNVMTFDDGVTCCADCGKKFPSIKREPFNPGDAFCAEVAERIVLSKPEWESFGEFNQCVSVYPDGHGDHEKTFWFGTANETWGADVYASVKAQEEGVIADSLGTAVPREEQNVRLVADAIVRAVERYEASHEFLDKLNAFKRATMELGEAWEKLDSDDDGHGPLVTEYPFKEDFNEVVLAVIDWYHAVEEDKEFGIYKENK